MAPSTLLKGMHAMRRTLGDTSLMEMTNIRMQFNPALI